MELRGRYCRSNDELRLWPPDITGIKLGEAGAGMLLRLLLPISLSDRRAERIDETLAGGEPCILFLRSVSTVQRNGEL